MPNYVKNVLKIKNIKNADEILNKITIKEEDKLHFDFDKIIPMPKSLQVTSGTIEKWAILCALSYKEPTEVEKLADFMETADFFSKEIDKEEIKKWEKRYTPSKTEKELGITNLKELGETYIDNAIKYKTTSWYDWCISHWGTKWNALDTEIVIKNNYIKIFFQTAWSTPEPIFNKLSEMFENDMEIWYADEDIGSNCGKVYYKNGEKIIESKYGDRNFANRVWRM